MMNTKIQLTKFLLITAFLLQGFDNSIVATGTFPTGFVPNKGQIKDMNHNPVPNVLFKAGSNNLDLFITTTGITYCFNEIKEESNQTTWLERKMGIATKGTKEEEFTVQMFRVDAILDGATILPENIEMIERNGSWVYNYLMGHSGNLYGIQEYKSVRIKEVYPGIDWLLYINEKGLKYDFEVKPGADLSKIRIHYNGAEPTLQEEGSILLNTPMGSISENKPVSFQGSDKVRTDFHVEGETVSFEIADYDINKPIVIDPQLSWGTLYGGTGHDGFLSMDTDNNGNLYVTGYTYSVDFPTIDAGTYYNNTFGGGLQDAFVLKFDPQGALVWGTYLGGTGDDAGRFITTNDNGEVYVTGETASPLFPTLNSGGYFDDTHNGNNDVFITKFDSSGTLLWSTFYGGSFDEEAASLCLANNGNVYVVGSVSSANFPLLNSGGYFNNSNLVVSFILGFDAGHNQLYGSRFGGPTYGAGISSVVADSNNDIYVTGNTMSGTHPLLNNGGYFDGTIGGINDAYVTKFDSQMNILWSTYLGGSASEGGRSLAVDKDDNLFVAGYAVSADFPVLNSGTYFDDTFGGVMDAFVSKFDQSGHLLWSTYYGGDDRELLRSDVLDIDTCGNIFLCFDSRSSNMDTYDPGNGSYYNPTYSGSNTFFAGDGYAAKFSNNGDLLWGSYLGSTNDDIASCIAVDQSGSAFVGGEFQNYVSAASLPMESQGGIYFDDAPDGPHDSYIAKFISDTFEVDTATTVSICEPCNGTATATPTGAGTYFYEWSDGQNTQTATGLCSGIYTVTVSDLECRWMELELTINQIGGPEVSATAVDSIFCEGDFTTLSASGAATYAWSPDGSLSSNNGESVISNPLISTTYQLIGTDTNGCNDTTDITIYVNPLPNPEIHGNAEICLGDSLTLTASGGVLYLWSTGDSLTTIIITPEATTEYSVTVSDENGCSGETLLEVNLLSEEECAELYGTLGDLGAIYFPNAFTPNGDGLNDLFKAKGYNVQQFKMLVFDRWGELIFQSNSIEEGWDGRIDGRLAQNGVYVFKANYTIAGKGEQFTIGHATLIR